VNIPVTNGRNPTWKWVAGIAVALLLGLGSLLYAQTQHRIERAEDQTAAIRDLITATGELAKTNRSRIDAFEGRLGRIEDKLDRLLEHRP
jgi:uncharacterized protein HemX